MSLESIQVVSQTVRVHRLDFDTGGLHGEVDYAIKLRRQTGHLSLEVPQQARITSVLVDGSKIDTAYDSSAAQQLAVRINSCIYLDKRETQEWLPASEVFGNLLANRRDLLSLIEARNLLRSFPEPALTVFLPRMPDNRLIRVTIIFTSYESAQIVRLSASPSPPIFMAVDGSAWFPRLADGHLLAKSSVFVNLGNIPRTHQVLATGKIGASNEPGWAVFDSVGRLPVSSVALIIAPLTSVICPASGFLLSCLPSDYPALADLQTQWPRGFLEISQVMKHYLTDLPNLSIAFLPIPAAPRICGDLIIVGNGLLASDAHSLVFSVLEPLAEAVAASALQQLAPPVSSPWIVSGLRQCLAGRVIDAKLGTNEHKRRFLAKRRNFHTLVESGKDWQPLAQQPWSPQAELFELKSGLVMEALRVGSLGSQDFKHLLTSLVDRREGSDESAVDTDAFWDVILELVGRNTDKGARILAFREDYVESVGCPLLQVSCIFTDRRNLTVRVTQQPLQPGSHRLEIPSDVRLTCACGTDLTNKTEAGFEPQGYNQPATGVRRRMWEGSLDVSVFRAPHCPVTLTVDLRVSGEPVSSSVSLSQVTARKHEIVRPRQPRNDELVHGWICVEDEKWLLAKIDVYQGTVMWTNQLQFSRDVLLEDSACDALSHCRGSQWAIDVLADGVKNNYYAYGTRVAAATALAHMFGFAGEREAVKKLFTEYIVAEIKEAGRAIVKPQDVELFLAVFREMCTVVLTGPRAEKALSREFTKVVAEMQSRFRTLKTIKKLDEKIFQALSASVIATAVIKDPGTATLETLTAVKADVYGDPIRSSYFQASVSALSSAAEVRLCTNMSVLSPGDSLDILEYALRSTDAPIDFVLVSARVFIFTSFAGNLSLAIDWLEKQVGGMVTDLRLAAAVLEGWAAVRALVSRHRQARQSLDTPEICDRLWHYLARIAPACNETCVSEKMHAHVFELYRAVFGWKVPKTVDAREGLIPLDKDLEKTMKQNFTRGKYWQPAVPKSEEVHIHRKIQIGKVVRKFEGD